MKWRQAFVREFRVMIIMILNSMKKDIESIKKDQSQIKIEISEINNTMSGKKQEVR